MVQVRAITDSFDLYPLGSVADGYGVYSTWFNSTGQNGLSIVAGRFAGSQGMQIVNNNGGYRGYKSTDSIAVGFAMRMSSIISTMNGPLAEFRSSNGVHQLSLGLNDLGKLTLIRGNTVIAVADDTVILPTVWHYVELELFLHDSAGIARVYVDGEPVPGLQFTGDTKNSTDLDLGRIYLWSISGFSTIYDDFYLEVDGYERVGEGRMDAYTPNSTTSNTGWTQSTGSTIWGVVDEKPANITDWASAVAGASTFRLGVTDMVYAPEKIYGVQVESLARKDEAGTRVLRNKVWGLTGVLDGANQAMTLSTFTWGRDWFPLEPDGGVPWTLSQIVTADIGVEIVT